MEKLKQKVASSSSRLIASIQQAAGGTFQQQQQQQQAQATGSRGVGLLQADLEATLPSQQQQQQQQQQLQQQQPQQSQPQPQMPTQAPIPKAPLVAGDTPAGSSAARLMATDAAAHLSEKEREILLEVFKKEEQFQRDTIKQMTASRALQGPAGEQAATSRGGIVGGQQQQQQQHRRQPATRIPSSPSLVASAQPRSAGVEPALPAGRSSNLNRSPSNEQASSSPTLAPNPNARAQLGSPMNRSIRQQTVANQAAISRHSSPVGSSFASARSATPLSRPGSSSLFGTPSQTRSQQQPQTGSQQQHGSSRATSACSAATTITSSSSTATTAHNSSNNNGSSSMNNNSAATSSPNAAGEPLGQCRICRKFITTSELCHLCSNCNQFICEDCASYSASEQHWMCSSCKRRTTRPAIPADALKELGLNQNSSAVRRMTLRLNQTDLKQFQKQQQQQHLNKSSNESNLSSSNTSSSNSSSGCSSMSATNQPQQNVTSATLSSIQTREVEAREQGGSGSIGAEQRKASVLSSRASTGRQPQPQPQQQQQASEGSLATSKTRQAVCSQTLQAKQGDLAKVAGQLRLDGRRGSAVCADPRAFERLSAQKTLSQPPAGPISFTQAQPTDSSASTGQMQQQQQQRQTDGPTANSPLRRDPQASATQPGSCKLPAQIQGRPVQQSDRRASVAISGTGYGGGGDDDVLAAAKQLQKGSIGRKQSTAFFTQNSAIAAASVQRFVNQEQVAAYYGPLASRYQLVRPQTLVTASSETSMHGGSQDQLRRDSMQLQQQGNTLSLIPFPYDQFHHRRRSDQSNLSSGSSLIAENLTSSTLARNRSHSNIDTVSYTNYLGRSALLAHQLQLQQQHSAGYRNSDENLMQNSSYSGSRQQIAMSNYVSNQMQQQQQQRLPGNEQSWQTQAQLQQQEQQQHAMYAQHEQYQQQQQQIQIAPNQQQISSIVTSYAQKRRRSSEEIHSESSSDIEDDARVGPLDIEFDNEQPNEYFAPPRALAGDYMTTNEFPGPNQAQPISIPSVSVSEFSSSQLRHQRTHLNQNQNQNQNQPQQLTAYDSIMTTPMQINVAIEQAILQQQQQQQQKQHRNSIQATTANELQMLNQTNGYLNPRRGSSGRILPRVPGEQSRSLLDLPHNNSTVNTNEGASSDQHYFMLDLPSVSPTVRRASAPEGQNIKIVVDDMDSSMRGVGLTGGSGAGKKVGRGLYGTQGELYERLVLYRDDSLDPDTNMARGFGLQVMGGKIDENDNSLLQAVITWTLPGGSADKVGLQRGDRIIEWDGKCLINMTYEQVAEVIESSANIAELLVLPAHKLEVQPGANYVRSQKRMSQQTERDLKRTQHLLNHFEAHFLSSQQNSIRDGWNATGESENDQQLDQQMRRLSGAGLSKGGLQFPTANQQAMAAVSAGNSPRYSRVGTGRRLPQIPSLQMNNADCLMPGDSMMMNAKHNSSSASQLEQISMMNNGFGDANHLSARHDAQHAHSASELYSGQVSAYQQQQQQRSHQHQMMAQTNGQAYAHWQQQQQQSSTAYDQNQQLLGPFMGLAIAQPEIRGLIGLQVNVDERTSSLEISILSAINIERDLSYDYYVRVKILPESNLFKPCTTQPSSDMNWKETFIFQNFPTQQIHRMALEIGVWVYDEAPRLSAQLAQPICEALIPIQSARERNTDFWPLRAPPTSPQARRKSLNDLIETHSKQAQMMAGMPQQPHTATIAQNQWELRPKRPFDQFLGQQHTTSIMNNNNNLGSMQQQIMQPLDAKYPIGANFTRERSSSNRNLPDTTHRLVAQPRRASDEVSSGYTCRLSARVSPAASRRSISVMNVGGDGQPLFSRPSSRLGSQANLFKNQLRRDSHQHQHQVQQSSGSPKSKLTSPSGSNSRPSTSVETSQVGVTPSGRRSSIVGIQSMTGYKSQKNSQSDATDQDSPMSSAKHKKCLPATQAQSSLLAGQIESGQQRAQQHRASVAGSIASIATNQPTSSGSNAGSRRGSSEQPSQIQRKGSLAMQTLRKLKRTMSLTKGSDPDGTGSGQGSRRSSSNSTISTSELGEDMGVTRRVAAHKDSVGKLKLSLTMTKGQLEVEVISGHGLKFDLESSLGIYVKTYLKGKHKSNKRKTRLARPWQSPTFKQLIKYDGSLVDNKSLEVSVWQKQGGLKGKVPIGFTEIRLAELNLSQIQVGLYNLRPMEMMGSSSVED